MILVVHAHPDPESFTRSLAASVCAALRATGRDVVEVDLYRVHDTGTEAVQESDGGETMVFPPVLERDELRRKTSLNPIVQRQMRMIEKAEAFVVVHPDWWGGPPAVLKGWIDRVLRPGTAYEIPEGYGHREPAGLLAGRRAVVAVTGDADGPGPLAEFWTDRVWGFCGVDSRILYCPEIGVSTLAIRKKFLNNLLRTSVDFLTAGET